MALSCISFWVLKQLLVLHYQRLVTMAKQLNEIEIQYLFLFCVLGEEMQSEEKFEGEIHSKKDDRICTGIISQVFLKYLYLRFQISQISFFTTFLLGGIDFNCVREKRKNVSVIMLRQKNWSTINYGMNGKTQV